MNGYEMNSLLKKGRDAWNSRAEEMLAEKRGLQKAGLYTAAPPSPPPGDKFSQALFAIAHPESWKFHVLSSVFIDNYAVERSLKFSGLVFPGDLFMKFSEFKEKICFANCHFHGNIFIEYSSFRSDFVFENNHGDGIFHIYQNSFHRKPLISGNEMAEGFVPLWINS